MLRIGRLSGVAVLAATIVAVAAGPASARTVSFRADCTGKVVGTTSSAGRCTSTFGSGTYRVTLHLPNYTVVERYKGGTITVRGTARLKGGKITGSFRIVGGTGKFRHARGSGTATSSSANGVAHEHERGRITY